MTTRADPPSGYPAPKSSGCLPGLAAAAAAVLVMVLVSIAATYNASAIQAEAAGQIAAICGLPLVLLAAASGLVWRAGRRPGIVATALAMALVLVYAAFMVVPVLTRPPPRLVTDHDRSPPLVTMAASRQTYAWPQLGVELDLPAGFDVLPGAPAVARFADVYPSVVDQLMGWHWRRGREEVAIVLVCDRAYVHLPGLLEHAVSEAGVDLFGHGARVVSDTPTTDGGRELVLRAPGIVEHAHVVAFRRPDAVWRLLLFSASSDDASAAQLVAGLRVSP